MPKIKKKPKKISNYWNNRLLEQQANLWDTISTTTEAELAKQYLRLEQKVENELNRLLLEIIKDKGTPEFNVADLYKFNRYYDLENFIREELNKSGVKEYEIMKKNFTDMYKENYKIVGKYYGSISNKIDKKKVEQVINEYWTGNENFSSRIWKNKALLNESLKNSLVDVVALGESHDKVAMSVMKDFGVSYNNAIRLARTEITRVQNESTIQRYKDSGITQYEVVVAADERTCDICSSLEGKKYYVDEVDPGVNCPPFHPNCRCALLAVINDVEYEDAPNYHPER